MNRIMQTVLAYYSSNEPSDGEKALIIGALVVGLIVGITSLVVSACKAKRKNEVFGDAAQEEKTRENMTMVEKTTEIDALLQEPVRRVVFEGVSGGRICLVVTDETLYHLITKGDVGTVYAIGKKLVSFSIKTE